jgi:hypothetical protein
MIAINSVGEYVYVAGTKRPLVTEHPVYQARVEVALGQGTWLYAPTAGHTLARFDNAAKTDAKVEEFQKELSFYLRRYGPEVTERLLSRFAVDLKLQIAEDALNV